MLSKDTKFRLAHAVTDFKVAEEIEKRMTRPAQYNQAGFQAKVASLDESLDAAVRERLVIALAGDARGAAGQEIAQKLDAIVAAAKTLADGAEVALIPAESAFFEGQVAGMTSDVRIDADNEGEDGNLIALSFDGNDDIDTALAAWNLANPANTATLASGDGSQVPSNGEAIALSGGADEVPAEDANSGPALAALATIQTVSDKTLECMVHALTDRKAAEEMKALLESTIVWYLN